MTGDEAGQVEAVVALGANLGNRAGTLDAAVAELDQLPDTALVVASRWHDSVALTPEGLDPDKPPYLNGVAVLRTRLQAHALLNELRRIELAHGRDRSAAAPRWGDRTLDLDLIVHGDARFETPELTLPHPRAHERDFVLRPWLEVRPDAVVPGQGAVAELLARVTADRGATGEPAAAPEVGGRS
ncbi:2-amino-4-hydroxy-6-hydroxymethyldihydropteridine diphosphokinase [Chryseoglobus sp. 28M-23]|uniref:2-amino-4-hydroxy-6- hydroxymethyldihydropteridine diphosphokinase n=1 Tax=Chryseoglobus sp. 28M-23 TaxID=2772253 RepID=UPI001747049B|nr:2-amino-4-hydroxy-6-hydroxymethyldihydropteridine diphosphokinase [Chryseoglobus sp. 28M-23]QOD93510.1 2-amino-4-hydroxy-6-hydroxymethyldihydropteridine diphosphokinase [Chryseoglobus sp. 28M-23]